MRSWVIGLCFVILSIAHLALLFRVSSIESRMAKEATFLRMERDPRGVVDQISMSVRSKVLDSLATSEELKTRIVESINKLQLEKSK